MIRVPHAHEGLLAFWKQFINVKFIIISKCPYMSTFRLLCNLCSSAVDGIAYRTRCAHLFCPTCAKATFQRSTLCSICNVQQHETDVHEIKVGIAITDDMLRGVVFQYLLQNTDWEPIRDKLNALAEESLTTTNFVATQLLLAANSNSREKSRMELELSNQADHLVRIDRFLLHCAESTDVIFTRIGTSQSEVNSRRPQQGKHDCFLRNSASRCQQGAGRTRRSVQRKVEEVPGMGKGAHCDTTRRHSTFDKRIATIRACI